MQSQQSTIVYPDSGRMGSCHERSQRPQHGEEAPSQEPLHASLALAIHVWKPQRPANTCLPRTQRALHHSPEQANAQADGNSSCPACISLIQASPQPQAPHWPPTRPCT